MEELDPEVLLVRQLRRRRIGVAIGIGVIACIAMVPCCSVVGSCSGEMIEHEQRRAAADHALEPAQRARIERALAAAEATLPAREAEFAASTEGLEALVPRPDLGPCPIHVPLRTGGSAQDGWSVDMNYDRFEAFAFPGRQSFPWALRGRDGAPGVAALRDEIASMRQALDDHDTVENLAARVDRAERLASSGVPWDVVIVPEDWRMPSVDATGSSFEGGYAIGTAYLHDYASGSVICAGHFEAQTTSEVVDYQSTGFGGGSTLQGMLQSEMDSEIERAISRAIQYRAGPRLPIEVTPEDAAEDEP